MAEQPPWPSWVAAFDVLHVSNSKNLIVRC